MSQRVALAISAALTAFVLVLAGALYGRITYARTAETDPAAADPAAVEEAPAELVSEPAPADLQAYQQREAEYQALIEQANSQLERAYGQLGAAAPGAAAPAAAPAYAVTADLAIEIAQGYLPNSFVLGVPELFAYKEIPAWAVSLDLGPLYIDAQTGAILYDGTLPPVYSGGSGGGGMVSMGSDDGGSQDSDSQGGEEEHEEENEDEHEGGEGGDD